MLNETMRLKKKDIRGNYKVKFDLRRKTYPYSEEEQTRTMLDAIELAQSLNVDLSGSQTTKRKGWKTFEGMVYQLGLINSRYLKRGISGDFTVRLPLKTRRKKRRL